MPLRREDNLAERVDLTAQGRLLTVKTYGEMSDRVVSSRRGDVQTFTPQSRFRMLKMLARLECPRSDGYRFKVSFVTLTTRKIYHPREFKDFMVRWFKRLGRKHPHVAVVWRLEYQKRGAPHVHLILYNAPWIDKDWVQETWAEIVQQEKPFTRIERIKSYKHLMSYASKYCGKVQEGGFNNVTYSTAQHANSELVGVSAGRVWGVYNRAMLPFAEKNKAVIPNDGAFWLIRRYCQGFYPWLDHDSDCGFTVFVDDPYHALAHIVRLSDAFGAVA